MARLQIKYHRVDQLTPHPRNPRTHSKKQIEQLARSIVQFGFTNPILIDNSKNIIAGHGRVHAAHQLGMENVPTITLEELIPAQIRAYLIADNKLAENASWDRELLALELQFIESLDIEFDLSITGFEIPEIDVLLSSDPENTYEEESPIPLVTHNEVITQRGDLWLLGEHRVLCGDFLHHQDWKTLMGRHRAYMVFADPPYNVPIQGHVNGLGSIQHEEFAMAHGEMKEEEFIDFLETLFAHLTHYSRDGAMHFVCMDWRHQYELLTAAREHYTELKNLCVWNKTNGGMGSLYRSKHELIYVFKHGRKPHINNVELGMHGRYRSNVWEYPGNNAFHTDRDQELAFHPTSKPVAMIADAMLDCSHRHHLVVDPCCGSGSTILAAARTKRRVFAMELEPKFVDTTILRWQAHTDQDATHVLSGQTFSQQKQQRIGKEVTHG